MRKACIIFIFFLLLSWHAMAIDAVVAHTVFYSPDPAQNNKLTPVVETYWQINQQTIHYKTTPEKTIVARIKTDIIFMNDTGIINEGHYILQTVPRANVAELMNHSIIELRRYALQPGFVKMKLVLTDLADSVNRFTYLDSFTIPPVAKKTFYSELQLLDTVIESAAETAFKKNGRQQVPVCANFLDENKTMLHYYAELYGANKISADDYPLIQKISLVRKERETPTHDFQRTDSIKSQEVSLVSGSFPIAALASGNYFVRITLENNSHNIIATQSLFFQRLNLHPATIAPDTSKTKKKVEASDTAMEQVTLINLNKTFVAKYDLGRIRAILKMLLPFSNGQETQTINNFLKAPDETYMRYYIYNYFSAINKDDPGKAWKDFTEKIEDVNARYNTKNVPGYETDRGFMYLRYGQPTDVITVENENGSLPYEIWQYDVLTQTNHKDITNGLFLFYKPNQIMSDFRLLHSTVSGEIENPAWRSYLYLNGNNNGSSRAEQYFPNNR